MSKAGKHVTVEELAAFSDAFNRHDADALMTFMTTDCVFETAGGPEVYGTRYQGHEAVRAAFAQVWANMPDAHWGEGRHFVDGDRGVSEWTFTGTNAAGLRVEAQGVDLFEFRDGKSASKRAFRKDRPLQK